MEDEEAIKFYNEALKELFERGGALGILAEQDTDFFKWFYS